ncbi:CACTA en-spm transposon protein [Cucumis melo var. makuwa]|uniref:CACTA en-spm transposon protein n=1 Tax=Cucumis melo var. makuwa TaxID=1194695 RepID=A0A5A7VRZ9_CUCMM|nr:CACTA en-spm transposon protein [Cucumis melo var. makuwa]
MTRNARFLEFGKELNTAGGSSLVDHNSGDCLGVHFQSCCLGWDDVGREYIKFIKGDLQHHFVLYFNDQAMNRFVEHQMLTSFKEFSGDYHSHFKKYSDPKQGRANPPHILVECMEDWHFLCNHYMSRAFHVHIFKIFPDDAYASIMRNRSRCTYNSLEIIVSYVALRRCWGTLFFKVVPTSAIVTLGDLHSRRRTGSASGIGLPTHFS